MEVDHLAVARAAEGHGEGVDRQVATGEVLGQVRPLERGDVDRAGQAPPLHAPGAEVAREPEAGGAGVPGHRRGRGGGVAVDGDVDVGARRASGQGVAHRPSDDPGTTAQGRQRPGEGLQTVGAHPTCTRGTRGPTAQVTS